MAEFAYALNLGIGITTGFYPVAAKGNGKLEEIEAAGFKDKAAGMKLSADTLVFATGQKAEDQSRVAAVKLTDKGTIAADDNGIAGDGIFAAGDIVTADRQ